MQKGNLVLCYAFTLSCQVRYAFLINLIDTSMQKTQD